MPLIPLPSGFKGTHNFPFVKRAAAPQVNVPAQSTPTNRPSTGNPSTPPAPAPSHAGNPGEPSPQHLNPASADQVRPRHPGSATADRMDQQVEIFRQRITERKTDFQGTLLNGQAYTMRDRPYMEPIVKAYNAKYPGLNVHYADGLSQSAEKALKALPEGKAGHARIVCYDGSACHHTALDFRRHEDGVVTVVGVDSRITPEYKDDHWHESMRPVIDGGKVKAGAMYYTDVQRADYGCGVFALDFSKSMWKEEKAFKGLHDQVRSVADGRDGAHRHLQVVQNLYGDDSHSAIRYVDETESFNHLPVRMAKNVQSTKDLKEIVKANPEAATKPMNKKGETVPERLKRITGKDYLGEGVQVDNFEKGLPADQARIRMYENGAENLRGLPG